MRKPKQITILRRHVLEAIRYNNLVAGTWYEPENFDDPYDKIYKPNCSACLVGSTVRRAVGINNVKTTDDVYKLNDFCNTFIGIGYDCSDSASEESIQNSLDDGLYLNALSAKFETTITRAFIKKYQKDPTTEQRRQFKLNKKQKEQLRTWVLENIPVKFTVKRRD